MVVEIKNIIYIYNEIDHDDISTTYIIFTIHFDKFREPGIVIKQANIVNSEINILKDSDMMKNISDISTENKRYFINDLFCDYFNDYLEYI